jgi:hypothetical protein
MTLTRPAPNASTPSIDTREVQWAADEIAALLRHVSDDSVVDKVLRQALLQLVSLKQSAQPDVIGPFRMKAAA